LKPRTGIRTGIFSNELELEPVYRFHLCVSLESEPSFILFLEQELEVLHKSREPIGTY
jgi:hypothetical protein